MCCMGSTPTAFRAPRPSEVVLGSGKAPVTWWHQFQQTCVEHRAQGISLGTAWLWGGSRRSPECSCWSGSPCAVLCWGAGTAPCQPGCPGGGSCCHCSLHVPHSVHTHPWMLCFPTCAHSGHSFPARAVTTALLGTVWVKPSWEKYQVRSGGNPSLQTGRELEVAALPAECKIILKALKQWYCSYFLCLSVVNADFWGDLRLPLSGTWEHKAFPDCQTALNLSCLSEHPLGCIKLSPQPWRGRGLSSTTYP